MRRRSNSHRRNRVFARLPHTDGGCLQSPCGIAYHMPGERDISDAGTANMTRGTITRQALTIGAVAACAAALATGPAVAAPGDPITTQIGVVDSDDPRYPHYVLQDEAGRQVSTANGYTESPTGQVTWSVTLNDASTRLFGLLSPKFLESVVATPVTHGPFTDGDFGRFAEGIFAGDAHGIAETLSDSYGAYGSITTTVSYPGDSNYGAASKTSVFEALPPEGKLIPAGSLTATSTDPEATVTFELPPDATGTVAANCVPRSVLDAYTGEGDLDSPLIDGGAAQLVNGAASVTCSQSESYLVWVMYNGDDKYGKLTLAMYADLATGGTTKGIDPATSLAPGQPNVGVTVDGLAPNTEYTTYRNSIPVRLGTVTTNSQGQATFTDALPDDLADGHHHYSLEDGAGTEVASAPFTVSLLAPNRDDASFTATADTTGPGTTEPGTNQPGTGSMDFES